MDKSTFPIGWFDIIMNTPKKGKAIKNNNLNILTVTDNNKNDNNFCDTGSVTAVISSRRTVPDNYLCTHRVKIIILYGYTRTRH